jgi:arylsulfatase A-like enzyme
MRAAHRWLESGVGKNEPFFLTVDTFDPHEPWDAPRYYVDMYDPNYKGDELFEPAYEPADYATPSEIEHMRKLYAAEVTLVDRWIGYLIDGLARMGLAEETATILTSDHGFYHGEHNLIGKVQLEREGPICRRWPCYDTIAHAPLIIKLPGMKRHRTVTGFSQPPDLMPTILEIVGAQRPATVQGASLMPLTRRKQRQVRDLAITSHTYLQDAEARCPTAVRTDDYLYIYGGDEWPSELYDLIADPGEQRNILAQKKDVGQALHARYLKFLEEIECPKERIDGRREFCPTPRTTLPRQRWL